MAIRYGYFDSEVTGVDENGMPVFDRAETSDLFRLLFANLVSSGVLATPGDCFKVNADTGLTVRIRPGFAMINGAFAYDAEESTVTLATANANLPRIDRVVLRCNYLNRLCEIITKTGTPASIPAAPELLQPASGDYYELCLATVRVEAGATSVTQSAITDTRGDSSVCGFITQLIDHLDTSEFMSQLTAWQEEYSAEQQAAFTAWFNEMKDQLSEDAAGNLQLEIDSLTQSAEAHDESIGQINEIIGDADMGTTAPTVTAAIKDLYDKIEVLYEDDLSMLVALDRNNVTINAGQSYAWFNAHVPVAGYRAKGIAGTRLYDATGGGNYLNCGFSFCETYWNAELQCDDLDFAIRNHGTATAKIRYHIMILYQKVRS